jgi:histidine decarboxylase
MISVTSFAEEGNLHYPGCCPITEDGSWPDEVPSHNLNHGHPKSGTIKVGDLKKLVEFFVKREYPIYIVLNQGSTWKGAYDNVPKVDKMLKKLGKKYPWLWNRKLKYKDKKFNDKRRGFWLHIDGALGASYLPFLRMAQTKGEPFLNEKKVPEFDFSIDSVMSIVCSMHKWIGAPWPGGVYMTRRSFQISPPDTAGYIGSPDTTLGGSRNGFSPMLFWKYFAKNGYEQNINRAIETEKVAALFETEITKLEKELQERFPDDDVDLWIHRSELSLAVLFRKVNESITYKYTVDSERINVPLPGKKFYEARTYSHIYSMTSLGKFNLVEKLIGDIREACKDDWKNAFPDQWTEEENGEEKKILNPGPQLPITKVRKQLKKKK